VPNPIHIDFGGEMALVGYDLDGRVLRPGDAVTATFYWRGLERMETNYTISAQLVDPAQNKAAQHDGWPQEGAAPTAAWEPDHLVVDGHRLLVSPEAVPGVYDLRVAIYRLEEEEIVHLPVVSSEGRMLLNYVLLTNVRVVP
jgi:hypothetical protein